MRVRKGSFWVYVQTIKVRTWFLENHWADLVFWGTTMSADSLIPSSKFRYSDAANFTTLKVSTLRHLVSAKKIPFIKVGRTVLFDSVALEKWLQDKSVQPIGSNQ